MSNRLSIEIAEVKFRSAMEAETEIRVFDDYDSSIIPYEKEIPGDPAGVLKLICAIDLKGYHYTEHLNGLLAAHIVDADKDDGIYIEGDWIELQDPRISEIIKAYLKDDKDFFGITKEDEE
jgi:hypothetical protein